MYGVVGYYPKDFAKNSSLPLEAIYGNKVFIKDAVGQVLCRSAGYDSGTFDKEKYNMGTATGLTPKYIINCKGTENSILDCYNMRDEQVWNQKSNAGFKCTFDE